jgi:hypothetical protein
MDDDGEERGGLVGSCVPWLGARRSACRHWGANTSWAQIWLEEVPKDGFTVGYGGVGEGEKLVPNDMLDVMPNKSGGVMDLGPWVWEGDKCNPRGLIPIIVFLPVVEPVSISPSLD